MKYAKIIDNIVFQVQPNKQEGFVEVDENIVCGMLKDGDEFVKPNATLEQAKTDKKQELTNAFNEESTKDVDVNGVLYHGGFDSALKLDGAKRISESAGATEVTFFDTSNKGAILSIGAATNVIAKIGAKYQIDFAKFEGLKVELEGKQKVSTVESMRW